MTRRTDRRAAGQAGADASPSRAQTVAVVVAEPGDAVVLVQLQEPGTALAVVSLQSGGKEGREALGHALAQAESRGCRVLSGPVVLGADGPAAGAALLDCLMQIDPDLVHTLDPDPARASFEEAAGRPVHDEPPRLAEAAGLALGAARALQEETGRPVFVDCHRSQADPRGGSRSCRRHPLPVNWLVAGTDGRLTAFQPTAAGVVRWHQDALDGDHWHGPELLEGPGLLPGLTVIRDPYGFPVLFGLRRTVRPDGAVDVEVVHAAQFRTGRPLTPWHALGGPNVAAWQKGREVGFPAAAFDASGRLFVFVRNFGHSISYRCQETDGSWQPWQHLGGTRVADDLVAVTGAHGGVEVYARVRDKDAVVRWFLPEGGDWTEDRSLPFAVRPGSMAPAPDAGALLFRDLWTNEVQGWRPGTGAPYPLGANDGTGAVAIERGIALNGWTYALLAGAGRDGACSVGVHPEGQPDAGVWWQDLGLPGIGAPAAAMDRKGRLAVATRTAGGIAVTRRRGPVSRLDFGTWNIV
ncbi:hypothetical protein ACIBI4_24265 [Streptomyces sp. NPDC050418]|uniref:hypothetical protein n=1 Tax=Streptomyces sp. NPDC050418 TaxID=3365612 RepID=UPI0037B9019B